MYVYHAHNSKYRLVCPSNILIFFLAICDEIRKKCNLEKWPCLPNTSYPKKQNFSQFFRIVYCTIFPFYTDFVYLPTFTEFIYIFCCLRLTWVTSWLDWKFRKGWTKFSLIALLVSSFLMLTAAKHKNISWK